MNRYHKLAGLFFLGLLISACNAMNEGVESSFTGNACLVKSPAKPKGKVNYKVNFFLETSGSMNGFMSKMGTEFQKDIWGMVNLLDANDQSGFSLYEVPAKGEAIKAVKTTDFRNKLNVGTFSSAKSTDIPEILDSILVKTNQRNVSIFVSDLIFAPSSGTNAALSQITSDIYKRFSNQKFASVIYQLKSKIYNSKSKVLSQNSPYYVWIIGPELGVKSVAEKLRSALPPSYNEVNFGIGHDQPKYSILPHVNEVSNAIATPCEDQQLYYCYSEFDDAEQSKIILNIGLNLSELSKNERDQAYLLKNFYSAALDAKIKVNSIGVLPQLKNAEDQKLAKRISATHLIKLEVDQIYNDFAVLEINFRSQRPHWIADSNLDTDDYRRERTFGLTKMIAGLENAYRRPSDQLLFRNPFKILITKNN